MKIGIGKSRKFIIGDKMVRCICTAMEKKDGVTLLFLRAVIPPFEQFWYNPKKKEKVIKS